MDFLDMVGKSCNQCKKVITSPHWCQSCNSPRFQKEFNNWKSGSDNIDAFIREAQLEATSREKILEWIPCSKFEDVTYLAEGGFGKVYSAKWIEGYILYWNVKDSQWKRKGVTLVALKYLSDSQNIIEEFLDEIKNLHNCNDDVSRITRCYGISRDSETDNFVIVMQLIEDGNLRSYLPILQKMSWKDKFTSLFRISEGLYQIHKAKLVHRDFHTGNILLSRIRNNALYITDMGLCKPIAEYSNNEAGNRKIFGVLPYVAPEVLCGEEYTGASDVYSFGIIMSEVLTGVSPFNDVPHDNDLAIEICNGLRPKIQNNTPALIVELMQRCWDAKPQNRLNAYDLRLILSAWQKYESWPDSELTKQIRKSEEMISNSLTNSLTQETHLSAIYTSRHLNFRNLPKPTNSIEFVPDSGLVGLKIK